MSEKKFDPIKVLVDRGDLVRRPVKHVIGETDDMTVSVTDVQWKGHPNEMIPHMELDGSQSHLLVAIIKLPHDEYLVCERFDVNLQKSVYEFPKMPCKPDHASCGHFLASNLPNVGVRMHKILEQGFSYAPPAGTTNLIMHVVVVECTLDIEPGHVKPGEDHFRFLPNAQLWILRPRDILTLKRAAVSQDLWAYMAAIAPFTRKRKQGMRKWRVKKETTPKKNPATGYVVFNAIGAKYPLFQDEHGKQRIFKTLQDARKDIDEFIHDMEIVSIQYEKDDFIIEAVPLKRSKAAKPAKTSKPSKLAAAAGKAGHVLGKGVKKTRSGKLRKKGDQL